MLSVLLFIAYLFLLSFVLNRLVKIKQIPIKSPVLISAFLFKCLLGCLYGYIFLKYYHGDDTWMYHNESLEDYRKLVHHPVDFFKDLLPISAFKFSGNFGQGMFFYMMDLENWSMIKLLAVFNVFSRGNYYINVLFFDFLVFMGPLLLFRLFVSQFPEKKKILVLILFFLPSVTFWLSGIRAEGLLLLFLSMVVYYSRLFFQQRKYRYSLLAIGGLAGILIFRSQFLLTFIPAFLSWTLCWDKPKKAVFYFSIVYITGLLIFFASPLVSAKENLPALVAGKQKEFLQLHGNTMFRLDTLQPSLSGFVRVFPEAFGNTLLRPFIWEAKGPLQLLTAVDIIAFWLVIFLFLAFPVANLRNLYTHPLLLLLLFYSLSQIILIGYTVPFPGAIIRYKVIPQIMLILYIGVLVDWRRILDKLNK
jgi:hypothetical protein